MSHRDGIRSNMDYQRPTRAAGGNGSTQPDFGVYYDPTQPADHTVTPSRLDALANLAAGTAKKRGREAGGEEEVLYFEQKGGTQPLPLATGTLNLDWVEHRGARCANAQCECCCHFCQCMHSHPVNALLLWLLRSLSWLYALHAIPSTPAPAAAPTPPLVKLDAAIALWPLIFVAGITKPIRWSSSWAAPRLPRWSASWTMAKLLECAGSSAKG